MPDPFARPLSAIDCELRSILTLQRDADQQLDTIRREINERQAWELNLVAAIDARRRRIDLLLDERWRSTTAERLVTQ